MIYEYRVLRKGMRERIIKIHFEPYENLLKDVTNSQSLWTSQEPVRMLYDTQHPIIVGAKGSSLIRASETKEEIAVKATIEVEIGKNYLFTTFVRNNDALSSALYIDGKFKDSVTDPYTQRIAGTFLAETDTVEVELRFYDSIPRPDIAFSRVAWVGGELLTEIKEDKPLEELLEQYEYIEDSKQSPSAVDLLKQTYFFSPYKFYVVANGRRLLDYNKPLGEYGIDKDTLIEVEIDDMDRQIYNAFLADVPLMAMLEGNTEHVTHAFPKEDREMTRLHESNFPRVQFFTGFAVNRSIADTKPVAEEVNFALNIYIPVIKVMESVDALMILNQTAAIMAELGWAKVRGSDYFLKNEQLYVLQTQYIQDQEKAPKRI